MSDHRLLFSKTGRARFISHLDLMRTFQRAFLRADIPIQHTEGFHPHAFVAIALPLSVGYSSRCEILECTLLEGTPLEEVPQRMNEALPEGIQVLRCYEAELPLKALSWVDCTMTLHFDSPLAQEAALAVKAMLSQESCVVRKKSKKAKAGFTEVDIIPLIRSYQLEPRGDILLWNMVTRAQNPGLNPSLVLETLTASRPELAPRHTDYARNALLTEDGERFE